MRFRGLASLLALAVPVHGSAAQHTDPTIYQQKIIPTLNDARQASIAGENVKAVQLVGSIIDDPGFAALPPARRAMIYDLGIYIAGNARQKDLTYRYARDGSELREISAAAWTTRFFIELGNERLDAAVTTIEGMLPNHAEALNGLRQVHLSRLDNRLRRDKNLAARRRLLKVLTDAAYQPAEPGASKDACRERYALLLAGSGDLAGATALVRQIELPGLLMRASLDRQLKSGVPPDFDAAASMERQLQRERDLAASHPGSLRLVLAMSGSLRALGRPAESLAVLDANRPSAETADASSFDYADLGEQLNWWWDERARAYRELGRFEEAADALRGGAKLKEGASANVSQVINLAAFQLSFARPADALATLAPLKRAKASMSPYGVMQLREVRGCAHAQLRHAESAKEDLDFIVAHHADDPSATYLLRLCMGDMDGAAAAVIARLDDPEQRTDALLELSDYAPPPVPLPPDPFTAGMVSLKARPDVSTAIERAGGIGRFTIQNADF